MCPTSPVLQQLCNIVTVNGHYDWSVTFHYIFFYYIVQAITITVLLAVLAQFFGVIIGLLLYFMRRSRWSVLRLLANAYITVFRGTPLIVQIFSPTPFFRI